MVKAVEVTGTWRDQAGKTATNTMYVPNGLTLAQYAQGLRASAVILDEVSGSVLDALNYSVDVDISALTGNGLAGTADVEDIGAFQFRTADNRPVNVNVPGIIDTLSSAGSDALDQTDTDVAAFISMFEDGIAVTGGTITPTDVDSQDIVGTVYAREEARNSGSRS